MATMERLALGAHSSQGPILTEQPANKRKLEDLPVEHGQAGILDTPESSEHGKFDANSALSDDLPMSETKRRAQNRAAQRAFRERKERHLRELEKRLVELESESRSWKSTNLVLRSQLSLLEEQLNHYRNPNQSVTGGPAPVSVPPTSMANPNVSSSRSVHPVSTPAVSDTHTLAPSDASQYAPHSLLSPHTTLDAHPDLPKHQPTHYGSSPMIGVPSNNSQINLYAGNMTLSPHYNDTIAGLGAAYSHASPSAMQPQSASSQPSSQNGPYHELPHLQTEHRAPVAENSTVDNQMSMYRTDKPPSLLSGDSGSSSQYADQSSKGSPDTPSRAEVFCEKLSMACGMHRPTPPKNAPKILAEVSGWQASPQGQDADPTANWVMQKGGWSANNQIAPYTNTPPDEKRTPQQLSFPSQTPSQVKPTPKSSNDHLVFDNRPISPDEIFNFDFGNMASGFGEFNFGQQASRDNDYGDTNGMGNLLNNDFGVFDPLDNLLSWDETKDHLQQPTPSVETDATTNNNTINNSTNTNTADDQLLMFPQNDPISGFSSDTVPETFLMDPQVAPQQTGFNPSMMTGDSHRNEEQSGNNIIGEVPAASQKFIPCADVWDRICSHPRFGEIDINSMCQELRNKARCSKMGVVLDEEDVDSVLKALR